MALSFGIGGRLRHRSIRNGRWETCRRLQIKKVEAFDRFEYELLAPGKDEGEYVAQIGWRRPVIVVKLRDHGNWDVIDTMKNQYVSISEEDRKTNPTYRETEIFSAEVAWRRLSARRRLWR